MTARCELPLGGRSDYRLKAAARRRRQAFARPLVGPPQYSPWFECSRLDSYVSIKTSSQLTAHKSQKAKTAARQQAPGDISFSGAEASPTQPPGTFRGIERKRKPLGWRALAPCVTCPHPETDRLEAKQLRMCLLSKRELRY